MPVLLLNPTVPDHTPILRSERCQVKALGGLGLWPPISLAEVAAVLREAGEQVHVLDAVVSCASYAAMLDEIAALHPAIVILQNTTPTVAADLATAAAIRSRLPECRIVFYGLHGTARPADLLGPETPVTAVIRHEPEATARELVPALRAGRPLGAIAGVAWRDGDRVAVNPDRELIADLDALPFPARDLLDQSKYILAKKGVPFTLIKTSRGCPYSCTYCTSRPYSKGEWRVRSAASVAAEVRDVQTRFGINDFMFLTDTFNVRDAWVRDLCARLAALDPKPSWMSNSRCDTINPAQARAMQEAGCWLVSLGIESGSTAILQRAKKGISLAQIEDAVRIFREAGIATIAYFMFGLPGETRATIAETMALVARLDPDYAYFYAATPFPGTEFFREAEASGWLLTTDWDRYYHGTSDVVSYPDLSAEEIQQAVRRAYRKFYLRPGRIARELGGLLAQPRALGSTVRAGWQLLKSIC